MDEIVLLGDEAVATGAIDSGITAAYAYPGTPSTEITEYIIAQSEKNGRPHAAWCANEKTAYEEALGVSFMGRRALVSMKHVGLNVAADPFVNSAILTIHGGLVLAVADDPGMHSSQNEQDSRYFADLARIICLDPANQQEAYEMTREAFDLSESFHIPVMVRLVTRLAHSRSVVKTSSPRQENPLNKAPNVSEWMLLPAMARKSWAKLVAQQGDLLAYSESSPHNKLSLNAKNTDLGVITTGIARNYYAENLDGFDEVPSHLHIGAYPIPLGLVRKLAGSVKRVVMLEEGYFYVERYLRGILDPGVEILGKVDGAVPPTGELNPDNIRPALGLQPREGLGVAAFELPGRPPQFCRGCPHADTYNVIKEVAAELGADAITSDIGCYALGALPPYQVPETIVDMGASVSMAKGASEAGARNVIAVIGDSTFLHSGVTPLMDAVANDVDMTVVIVDNETVAMTGGQDTLFPSSRLSTLIEGIGVDPNHVKTINAHRTYHDENLETFRNEMVHPGISVIIAVRECVETAKRKPKAAKASV